jgi:hypothetical protein
VRGAGLRAATRLVAVLALLPVPAFAEDAVPSREDLERFEWALDRAVRKVSRPSAAPILGGAEACRGYHLNGFGALFVLAPRSLPLHHRAGPESPTPPAVPDAAALPPPPRAGAEKLEATRAKAGGAGQKEGSREDLQALEAQVAALQQAAETAREEAEVALEETSRELHRRLLTSTLGGPPPLLVLAPPVPTSPGEAVGSGQIPPPSVPPWRFWFEREEQEEPRSPERVLLEVRSAVTDVLESHGPALRLRPEEFVAVVADFLPRSAFATRTRPARTLVVRVRKGELEDRAAGKLASDELRRRIEYSEY